MKITEIWHILGEKLRSEAHSMPDTTSLSVLAFHPKLHSNSAILYALA